jgi:hypothetical protein
MFQIWFGHEEATLGGRKGMRFIGGENSPNHARTESALKLINRMQMKMLKDIAGLALVSKRFTHAKFKYLNADV